MRTSKSGLEKFEPVASRVADHWPTPFDDTVLRGAIQSTLFGTTRACPRVGRFAVLRKVGAGGMGVVYSAYDEQLDRRVAIKMVRPEITSAKSQRDLILREARAMARLSHPNVAQIYEVGQFGDQLFLAMEFIDGPSVRQWLRSQPRTTREIVHVFLLAGRGLAAAHAKGLVHRDFKPDNVLIASDATPRVVDFGLVRPHLDASSAAASTFQSYPLSGDSPRDTGTGTPGYISPEQTRGEAASVAGDQYSFCVALYEALSGSPPGPVIDNKSHPVAPLGSQIPSWLRAVVARGLRVDPEARWPSMARLLDELERAPRRRRQWQTAAVALAVVASSVVAVLYGSSPDSKQRSWVGACTVAADARRHAWSVARRTVLHDALFATKVKFAADTWSRVETGLDRYIAAWDDAHRRVCDFEQTPSENVRARVECLQMALEPFNAVVDHLEDSGSDTIERAVVLSRLHSDPPSACADGSIVRSTSEPAPTKEGERDFRRALLDVQLDVGAGRFERALDRAASLVAVATNPLNTAQRTTVGLWCARAEEGLGHYTQAESSLKSTLASAIDFGQDGIAMEASVDLVRVVGQRGARYDEALVRAEYARALVTRLGGRPQLRASLDAHLGAVLTSKADYAEAERVLRRAIDTLTSSSDDVSLDIPDMLVALAWTFIHRQDFDSARIHLRRALALVESNLGSTHPQVPQVLVDLGQQEVLAGDYRRARATLERALELGYEALGPQHLVVAEAHLQLGWVAYRSGYFLDAKSHFERALEIRRGILPAEHPALAKAYDRLGVITRVLGKPVEAEKLHRTAMRAAILAFGDDNPQVVPYLMNLAEALADRRHFAAAVDLLEQAVGLCERHHGVMHSSLAAVLESLASVYERWGKQRAALPIRLREISVRRANASPGSDLGVNSKVVAALRFAGFDDQARELLKEGLSRARREVERRPGAYVSVLVALATDDLDRGKRTRALAELDEAAAVARQHLAPDANELLDLTLAQARALWDTGKRAQATAVVRALYKEDLKHGQLGHAFVVEEWMSRHGIHTAPLRSAKAASMRRVL